MLYSSLQSKYGVLKRHAEKIEMEMTQMHLWQAQAMEGMDEDFGDGMSVSFSNFRFRGGMDVCWLVFVWIHALVEFKIEIWNCKYT